MINTFHGMGLGWWNIQHAGECLNLSTITNAMFVVRPEPVLANHRAIDSDTQPAVI
jgi:hypothetical protein